MKFLFLIVACLTYSSGFAQNSPDKESTIKILDEKTNSPVQFATVSLNKIRYFSANENGVFILKKGYVNDRDTIRISAIGYLTKTYETVNGFGLPDIIRLTPNILQLNEVAVTGSKGKVVILGNSHFPLGGHRTYFNWEYALYIPNPAKKRGIIQQLQFDVSDISDGIEGSFKVNIFSRSEISIDPEKALINDDIIVSNPKRKGKVSVDISKYHIEIPENGFFIVAQLLSEEYYKDGVVYDHFQAWNRIPGLTLSRAKYNMNDNNVSYSLFKIHRLNDWFRFNSQNFRFTAKVLIY